MDDISPAAVEMIFPLVSETHQRLECEERRLWMVASKFSYTRFAVRNLLIIKIKSQSIVGGSSLANLMLAIFNLAGSEHNQWKIFYAIPISRQLLCRVEAVGWWVWTVLSGSWSSPTPFSCSSLFILTAGVASWRISLCPCSLRYLTIPRRFDGS